MAYCPLTFFRVDGFLLINVVDFLSMGVTVISNIRVEMPHALPSSSPTDMIYSYVSLSLWVLWCDLLLLLLFSVLYYQNVFLPVLNHSLLQLNNIVLLFLCCALTHLYLSFHHLTMC